MRARGASLGPRAVDDGDGRVSGIRIVARRINWNGSVEHEYGVALQTATIESRMADNRRMWSEAACAIPHGEPIERIWLSLLVVPVGKDLHGGAVLIDTQRKARNQGGTELHPFILSKRVPSFIGRFSLIRGRLDLLVGHHQHATRGARPELREI